MRLSTSFRSVLVAAVAALLCACASPAPRAPTGAMADSTCPVEVPGTSVTVEDTATGGALAFVTTGDVAELRRRVGAMATKHNQHHAAMAAEPGMGGGGMAGMDGGAGGMKMMKMVPAVATEEDIDRGARIVLVAAPADVVALRDQMRMHADKMASGTCMKMDAH